MTDSSDPRAAVPSVSDVLDDLGDLPLRSDVAATVVRAVVAEVRASLAPTAPASLDDAPPDGLGDANPVAGAGPDEVRRRVVTTVRARLDHLLAAPVGAINATGVVLHTGLGRAPLSTAARRAVAAAAGPQAVELDDDGRRGHRDARPGALVSLLTGAADATFANNGAGALVLALRAAAGGGRVAVARGELIEIGGSFRLPDVVAAAGVDLYEIGTTNRTHLADVEAALADGVDAVLLVHPSNYRVEGFTARPAPTDVATACHRAGVPLVHDAGSGLLEPVGDSGLADEPSIRSALADGADLVTGSGDKLLGGPQAGIVAGRPDLVAAARRDPLARALRLDKLRVAALVATLQQHLRDPADVPVRRLLATDQQALRTRARSLADDLRTAGVPDDVVEVVHVPSVVGGGSVPGWDLASAAVALPAMWAGHLRDGEPPVLARVQHGHCLVDLRAVDPDDDARLSAALVVAAGRAAGCTGGATGTTDQAGAGDAGHGGAP